MTLAMVFPGQGSQSVGMQSALAERYGPVRDVWREASDVLGIDLEDVVGNGPSERLNETVITQPAMLAAGVAAWRAWMQAGGPAPACLAGHSLGEYTALVCSDALDFADAVRLVQRRASLMQAAVPAGTGSMAAIIGLDDEAVVDLCREAADGQVVSAVNFNAPGQVVIAGDRAAVERAMEAAKKAGAKRALPLNVSVPSHCDLMRPAAAALAEFLADVELRAPAVRVVNNVDVEDYRDAAHIRDGLSRQLYSPVRWTDTVRRLIADGGSLIVECGPGKVLTGLAKRIDRTATTAFVDTPESLDQAIAASKHEEGE